MHPQPKSRPAEFLGLALAMSRGALVELDDPDADMPPLEEICVPGAVGRAAAGAWHVFEAQLGLPESPSAADLAAAVGRTVVVVSTDGRFRRELVSRVEPPTEPGGRGVAYLRLGHAEAARGMRGYRVLHRLWDALDDPAQSAVALAPEDVCELQGLAQAEPVVARLAALWDGWREGDGDLQLSPAQVAGLLFTAEGRRATVTSTRTESDQQGVESVSPRRHPLPAGARVRIVRTTPNTVFTVTGTLVQHDLPDELGPGCVDIRDTGNPDHDGIWALGENQAIGLLTTVHLDRPGNPSAAAEEFPAEVGNTVDNDPRGSEER